MSEFHLTEEAIADLWEIWDYIAIQNHNVPAADRLWADLERACSKLARMPTLGHRRKEFSDDPNALFYTVRENYVVVYRKGSVPLQIVRVFHGARDIGAELGDR